MKRSVKTGNDFYAVPKATLIIACAVFYAAIGIYGYTIANNAVIALLLPAILMPFFVREFTRSFRTKKKRKTEQQFVEALSNILSAVTAGNSLEQAFAGLCENCGKGTGVNIDVIAGEIRDVIGKTQMRYSFYDELAVFAERTESEDIMSCVNAMSIVGTRGGDMAFVIRNALGNMRLKLEAEDEIKGTLALPKYNLRIITAMPFFLVLLVKGISAGYLDPLYGTGYGIAVVFGVLAIIAAAWFFGRKLCEQDM